MWVITRIPAPAYFGVSAIFHYLGPAFAVLLFARVEVLGVAWLRIASAALVFALWRRPWRVWRDLPRDGGRIVCLSSVAGIAGTTARIGTSASAGMSRASAMMCAASGPPTTSSDGRPGASESCDSLRAWMPEAASCATS